MNEYTKYTYLRYSSTNFVEAIVKHLGLTPEELKDVSVVDRVNDFFSNDLYELQSEFYNAVLKSSRVNEMCFKEVKNSDLVKEFSILAKKLPEFTLTGGVLNYLVDEYTNESIFSLEVAQGQVTVIV